MGLFTRFKDIVNANINAMLDKAEDPEKMIRLMIQEMEDTLIELKTSCAGLIADRKKVERDLTLVKGDVAKWQERAELAVSKGRDDLAAEALVEKKKYLAQLEAMEKEVEQFEALISQSRSDIEKIEEKIAASREKQKLLVQRHIRAAQKLKTEKEIRKFETTDVFRKFDAYEERIDRLEAEASLVNPNSPKTPLDAEFVKLEGEDSIAEELAQLKKNVNLSKSNDSVSQ